MKIEEKFKSIRFRLFLTLCISIVLIIFCLIIVNNVLLEGFYLYSKISMAIDTCEDINDYYNGVIVYDINDKLEEIERKNNIDILIVDSDFTVIYCNDLDIINSVNSLGNINLSSRTKILYTRENIVVKSIEENRNNK